MCNDASQGKITPCQTRHGVEGSRVTWRTFQDRAFAKYGLLYREITTAPRLAAQLIHRPKSPSAFLYTFHRTNLIIRSVFAAYFDCEILHLAFVWRFGSFAAGMPRRAGTRTSSGAANFPCANHATLFHDAEAVLGSVEAVSAVVSTTQRIDLSWKKTLALSFPFLYFLLSSLDIDCTQFFSTIVLFDFRREERIKSREDSNTL